jgi:glyoxalase family protein
MRDNQILGFHHITFISGNAQRTTDFYTKLLGYRMVKQTVNFDDPTSYHLYYADEKGTPSTILTFFEWKDAPRGLLGIGGTHHIALRVADYDGLLKWKRRLTDHGLNVTGPYNRFYFQSIYFRDPDGLIIEIATDGPGFTMDEAPDQLGTSFQTPPAELTKANRDDETIKALTWPTPVPKITADMSLLNGIHHLSATSSDIRATHAFLTDVLEMRRVKMTDNFDQDGMPHWYWANQNADIGSTVTYFEGKRSDTRQAKMGTGVTHHYALAVADEDVQRYYQKRLRDAGYRVSQIIDRDYFKSIYSHDPDGHIVELATLAPGFAVDEPAETLGTQLQLPDWLEAERPHIENALTPLDVGTWTAPSDED